MSLLLYMLEGASENCSVTWAAKRAVGSGISGDRTARDSNKEQ